MLKWRNRAGQIHKPESVSACTAAAPIITGLCPFSMCWGALLSVLLFILCHIAVGLIADTYYQRISLLLVYHWINCTIHALLKCIWRDGRECMKIGCQKCCKWHEAKYTLEWSWLVYELISIRQHCMSAYRKTLHHHVCILLLNEQCSVGNVGSNKKESSATCCHIGLREESADKEAAATKMHTAHLRASKQWWNKCSSIFYQKTMVMG